MILEDGSIMPGAVSYVSVEDFIAYAASIGITVPDDAQTEAQLIEAAQYIDRLEPRLKGMKVLRDQPLAYPRRDLVLEGWPWAEDEIPRQVILAQMALALDLRANVDLYNRDAVLPVIKERVEGAVEIAYASPTTVSKLSRQSTATALLRGLMKSSGLFAITAERA